MITAEAAGEAGAEVEDEAVEVLPHPGEATAVSGRGGGHPQVITSAGTDTHPPPMTETDTSPAPGPGPPSPGTATGP